MNISSSLKKSFKSYNSNHHGRRISAEVDEYYEEKPILSDQQPMLGSPEVIVTIDGCARNIRRDSSLNCWNGDEKNSMQQKRFDSREDPPSKLIGEFLNKQKAAGGETSLDIDLEMDEFRHNYRSSRDFPPEKYNNYSSSYNNNNHRLPIQKEGGVSFQDPKSIACKVFDNSPEQSMKKSNDEIHNRRRSSQLIRNDGNESRVLKCTTIQRRASNFGRLKTRSRFDDEPPVVQDKRSGAFKSNQMRSGMLGKASGMLGKPGGEDEEDDPLFGEELPNDYKKAKFNIITISEWISLVLIMSALVCTLAISKWKTKKLKGLRLWGWEVLLLVLICGRLVSGWGMRIIVFFIERNFLMRKRVLYFVYGVRKAVQNCFWLGLVLIAWHFMFDHKVEGKNNFLRYVDKLMVCMLMASLLWLFKTLVLKVLASSFHVSTFFDRIQESLFNQYIIEILSGPPLIEIQNLQEEEEKTMAEVCRLQNAGAVLPPGLNPPALFSCKNRKVIGNGGARLSTGLGKGTSFKITGQLPKDGQDGQGGISIDQLNKLNHKNVSALNMKRLMNVVRNGALSTLDERVVDLTTENEAATEIRSECEAIAAARKIFRNVAQPTAKYIYLNDLMRFLREEEASKILNLVEGSAESERISKATLKSWVVNAFRERKALALTLNDTKTAVKKLHQMVNVIIGIIIVLICLIILEIATSKVLLLVSSQVVVVAFIFGNSCKTVFEAIIFVFVMHPFDVGDRCEIDGVQMVVEEMNILTTVFLRYDNQKILYPNVTLATKPISNYYRSPDMGDSVDFAVHIATPAEKIALIKEKITCYIEDKSEHWYPSPAVVLMNFENLHTLKLSVWLRHKINHQDMGEKWKRRALLVEEMVKIFRSLDIEFRLYPLDINIRSMPQGASAGIFLPKTGP